MVRKFLVFLVLVLIIFGLIGVVFAQNYHNSYNGGDTPNINRRSVSGHGGSSTGNVEGRSGSGDLEGSGTQQSSLRKDCTDAIAKLLIEENNITMCDSGKDELISRLTNPGQSNENTIYKRLFSICGGKGDPIRSLTIIGNIQLSINNICGGTKRDCMCKIRLNELEGNQSLFPAPQSGDITLFPGQYAKITVRAIFEGAGDNEEDSYTVYCGPSPNTVTPNTITISTGERKVLPNERYLFGKDLKRVKKGLWDYELKPVLKRIDNVQIFGSPDREAMLQCLNVPDSSLPKADSDGIKAALTPEFSLFGVLVALLVCVVGILGVKKRE